MVFNRLLFNKINLIVVTLLLALMVGVLLYTYHEYRQWVVNAEVENSQRLAKYVEVVRQYYTQEVVGKIQASGQLQVSWDHQGKKDTVPLPATMTIEVGNLIGSAESKTRIKLYSRFPFPHRKERVLDDVEQEALQFLENNPEKIFSKTDFTSGQEKLRIAIADRMQQACVDCHNSHPQTPRKGWKVGDVRGAVEIETSLSQSFAAMQQEFWHSFTIVALGLLALGALAIMLLYRGIFSPLHQVSQNLTANVKQVAESSERLFSASQSVAQNSSEQAASLEEISSSVEEMSSATRQNAENAQIAKDIAKQTCNSADIGAKGMQEMSLAVEAINTSAGEIAKIIKIIDEIASQTNILALNAAVEAARAGQAGRGFAVVADEVRSLARRSAQAANEIATKIHDSLTKSRQGVEMGSKVSNSLQEIGSKVHQMDERIQEIAVACEEQSQGIEQINMAINQVAQVTQSTSENAGETAGISERLSLESGSLKSTLEKLLSIVSARS